MRLLEKWSALGQMQRASADTSHIGVSSCRVLTRHSRVVAIDKATGRIVHLDPERQDDGVALHLLPWEPEHDLFCLVAVDGQPFAPTGGRYLSPLVFLHVRPLAQEREYSIAMANGEGEFFAAVPVDDTDVGDIDCGAAQSKGSEAFQIESRPPSDVSPEVRDLIGATRSLCYDIIQDDGPVPLTAAVETIGRCWRTMATSSLLALAERIGRSPKLQRAFAAAFADDFWFQTVLPGLLAWTSDRTQATPRIKIGTETDQLALTNIPARDGPLGLVVTSAIRRSVKPTRRTCIVATARNEGLYLIDWIAYHRSIGIEAIFLYTNDNDDGSDDLLGALADAGYITWIDNKVSRSLSPQFKAYGHAFNALPQTLDYEWVLVIDLDEFFAFDAGRFRSIDDYLAWHGPQPVDAVALSWLVFEGPDALCWNDAPVWQRFAKRDPAVNVHIKTISRVAPFWQNHVHYPLSTLDLPFRFLDSDGDPLVSTVTPSWADNPKASAAWINHYYYRSAAEFVWKKRRRTGDKPQGEAEGVRFSNEEKQWFVRQFRESGQVEDKRILSCAESADSIRSAMLSNAAIHSAYEGAKDQYRQRIAATIEAAIAAERSAGREDSDFVRILTAAKQASPTPDN